MNLIERAVQRLALNAEAKERRDPSEDVAYLPNGIFSDIDRARPASAASTSAGIPTDSLFAHGGDWGLQARRATTQEVRIDFEKVESSGILTPGSGNRRLAEELRVIKRRLLINAVGLGVMMPVNDGNLIMVTSAGSDEGKTFLATNLAISIATEIDRTVLLVDCDTQRADVTRILGIESKLGLADLLCRSDLDMADVLLKTNIDGFNILPAGSRVPHFPEQIASQKMARLMKEMAKRYGDRIIIFDSPPLLATTQASVLASMVGQIVLVVAAEKTKQSELMTAIERLDPSKAIGLVLNKSAERPETAHYESYQKL